MRQAYIAGPYTSPTEPGTLTNITAALDCAQILIRAKWFPIVPHVMGSHRLDWETALVRCRDLIRGLDPKTDALVVLPNWEKSRGAREEVDLAKSLGLRVLQVIA